MTSDVRFPDLIGKAAIVAGVGTALVDVVAELAANRVLVAIVAADRDVVSAATSAAEAHDVAVFGMTTDPADAATWERITQHIEQRLGPIDIAVAVGSADVHRALRDALARDMAARHRGVIVAIGSGPAAVEISDGARDVVLAEGTDPVDVARAASDTGQAG